MNSIGRHLQVTVFGESHNHKIGIVIDGLPAGLSLDFDLIKQELSKRRPKGDVSTPRVENDEFEVISGYYQNHTTGGPVVFLVYNSNTKSEDYEATTFIPRPGHADYPAYVKYQGFHDRRGGGMFSGRLTVVLVIAGAIAKQILNQKGIQIASHLKRIGQAEDRPFNPLGEPLEHLKVLQLMDFPVNDLASEETMKAQIRFHKEQNDSVGGSIESMIQGVMPGIGEPLFRSVESTFSQYLFSIPAIKGVSFGDGFDFQMQSGSQSSDGYILEEGIIKTIGNHNGGILGGITTGMPIRIQTVFKPTSSIGIVQPSVDLLRHEAIALEVKGRHDPAIVHRGIHVVNAVLYLALMDLLMDTYPKSWFLP